MKIRFAGSTLLRNRGWGVGGICLLIGSVRGGWGGRIESKRIVKIKRAELKRKQTEVGPPGKQDDDEGGGGEDLWQQGGEYEGVVGGGTGRGVRGRGEVFAGDGGVDV